LKLKVEIEVQSEKDEGHYHEEYANRNGPADDGKRGGGAIGEKPSVRRGPDGQPPIDTCAQHRPQQCLRTPGGLGYGRQSITFEDLLRQYRVAQVCTRQLLAQQARRPTEIGSL
jgi:hypothetical protein